MGNGYRIIVMMNLNAWVLVLIVDAQGALARVVQVIHECIWNASNAVSLALLVGWSKLVVSTLGG